MDKPMYNKKLWKTRIDSAMFNINYEIEMANAMSWDKTISEHLNEIKTIVAKIKGRL